MNVEPNPAMEVETAFVAEEAVEAQQTGLADIAPDVPPGQTVHFPAQQPRLTATAQATLNSLRQRPRA
jgi:hypothetical protein